nr:putative ribonuclease H-like domain-containing protein [Tanacetum cinerariifolium]
MDESHVLLKILRKNNMYSVDLKSTVPKGGQTCLFLKATFDESKLWHRRLGHINFKTINKLVKGNLVRGLPSKLFENDQPVLLVKRESSTEPLVLVTKPHNKNPYELFLCRKPALGFMKPFRCPVTILNTIDHLGKFDGKANEGFFVGYSINSKAFKVLNIRTRIAEENLHVQFSENTPNIAGSGPNCLFGKARMETVHGKDYILLPLWTTDLPFSQSSKSFPDARFKPSGDDEKKVDENPRNDSDEDCSIFEDNEDVGAEADVNTLDTTIQVSPIPTKRIHKDHPLDQVIGDLQSATQTRRMSKNLEEHGFVGFQVLEFPDRVYKVEKTLCGLHQAPRACSTKKSLCIEFEKMMHEKFQMNSVGELTLFLGLQVKQKEDGIFICQDKYVTEILKKFSFTDVKTASTPMETQKPLLKDEDGEEVDVHLYRSMIGSLMYLTSSKPDIMFAVCACARYQVNLKCKKQTVVANSITKAEYVAASSCCGQVLWIQNQLLDYRHNLLLLMKVNAARHNLLLLVDGKKVIVTESTVRRDLQLEDVKGVDCLPNDTIVEQLTLMGFVQVFLDRQLERMATHGEELGQTVFGMKLGLILVIPEYCVTLISVHKLAKDSKIFVAFDERRCVNTNDFPSSNYENDAQSSDDIFAAQDDVSGIEKFKSFLKSKFMVKDLGKLKYVFGIYVIDTDKGICLNQRKYVLDLLSKYDMLACKPAKTPLQSKLVITNEATVDYPLLDNITDYQKLKGKLIYLTTSRLDISSVVHCLS